MGEKSSDLPEHQAKGPFTGPFALLRETLEE
jgi:hypothetical protein